MQIEARLRLQGSALIELEKKRKELLDDIAAYKRQDNGLGKQDWKGKVAAAEAKRKELLVQINKLKKI